MDDNNHDIVVSDITMEEISLIVCNEQIKQENEEELVINIEDDELLNDQFVIEEYEELQESIKHPSIGRSKNDFLERLIKTKSCFLCTSDVLSSSLLTHFTKKHLQKSFTLFDNLVVQCKLGCKKGAHYHCPQSDCLFSCKLKSTLKIHYASHKKLILSENTSIEKLPDGLSEIKLENENDFFEVQDGMETKPDENFMKTPSEKASIAFSKKELYNRLEYPYCYLCVDAQFPTISSLRKHFGMVHVKNIVQIGTFFILPCRLSCCNTSKTHFHCPNPLCEETFTVKQSLFVHFSQHIDSKDKIERWQETIHSKLSIINQMKKWNIPQPKKAFDMTGVHYFSHESITSNAIEMYDQLCLPFCFLCTDGPSYNLMSQLERHFKLAHMNRGVDCGSCYLVLCGLNCLSEENIKKHYHCPYCKLKEIRRGSFWIHLESHRRLFLGDKILLNNRKKHKNGINVHQVPYSDAMVESPSVTISLSEAGENSIMKVEKTNSIWNEFYEGLPVNKYPSVCKDEKTILDVAQLPHCFLCNDDKDYINIKRLIVHIKRVHVKAHFKMGELMILLCKRYCGEKHEDRGHYHCLFCDFNARQKERVQIHIEKHISTLKKREVTAEYYIPPEIDVSHSVPDEWIFEDNREEVRHWEQNFNSYVTEIYCKNAKTNNNVIGYRKKCLIYNHLKLKMDVEDKSLKYWVKFRGIKVLSCSQLNFENVIVSPITKYNNDELNRVVDVQPKPPEEDSHLILKSSDPSEEFFKSYRLIPIKEEMFKILFQLHIMNGYHPTPKVMFSEIRRKYLYFPKLLVDKFVSLCPTCGIHYPDSSYRGKNVSVATGDSINLAGIQVTVVDMCDHPDGKYHYIVECFDRCSRLTWVFPSERAVATDLAESVIRSVLCITGLPAYIITNCGVEFLGEMLQEIDKRWNGPCSDLIERSMEAVLSLPLMSSTELMEALQELVVVQPTSWASALPHLQFRLNHTRGYGNSESSSFEAVFGKQRSRPNWQKFLMGGSVPSQPPVTVETEVEEPQESLMMSLHQEGFGL